MLTSEAHERYDRSKAPCGSATPVGAAQGFPDCHTSNNSSRLLPPSAKPVLDRV